MGRAQPASPPHPPWSLDSLLEAGSRAHTGPPPNGGVRPPPPPVLLCKRFLSFFIENTMNS